MQKIKLFCFPYAGGSATMFEKWRPYLSPQIELRPIELAGRGRRMHDSFYSNVSEVVEDIIQQIKSELGQPYALLGHSMGALLAFELGKKISQTPMLQPIHFFFSGKGAPHVIRGDKKVYHSMQKEDFKKEVLALGGTPPEFFDHIELLELFLPLLKNDFKIVETYIPTRILKPFAQDITVLLGKEDDLTQEQCEEWALHTQGKCNTHYFEGGHFFLKNNMEEILRVINDTVASLARQQPTPDSLMHNYSERK